MFFSPQLPGVISFNRLHDPRHFAHGVLTEPWRCSVRRLAACFDVQPHTAFVRRCNGELREFTNNGQIRLHPAGGQGA